MNSGLKVRVLLARTPCLVDGVLSRVKGDLVHSCSCEVDIQLVGQANEVQEHISHFLANGLQLLPGQLPALLLREPLKGLK